MVRSSDGWREASILAVTVTSARREVSIPEPKSLDNTRGRLVGRVLVELEVEAGLEDGLVLQLMVLTGAQAW